MTKNVVLFDHELVNQNISVLVGHIWGTFDDFFNFFYLVFVDIL